MLPPDPGGGGMVILVAGIPLFFLAPIGFLLNLLLLYVNYKKHIKNKITISVAMFYILFFLYAFLKW